MFGIILDYWQFSLKFIFRFCSLGLFAVGPEFFFVPRKFSIAAIPFYTPQSYTGTKRINIYFSVLLCLVSSKRPHEPSDRVGWLWPIRGSIWLWVAKMLHYDLPKATYAARWHKRLIGFQEILFCFHKKRCFFANTIVLFNQYIRILNTMFSLFKISFLWHVG